MREDYAVMVLKQSHVKDAVFLHLSGVDCSPRLKSCPPLFRHLMQLNKLAGRSFNDLMQYPVFPFVLSNYSSSVIDLADASSYRYRYFDHSKVHLIDDEVASQTRTTFKKEQAFITLFVFQKMVEVIARQNYLLTVFSK